jgi:hypothetical protein
MNLVNQMLDLADWCIASGWGQTIRLLAVIVIMAFGVANWGKRLRFRAGDRAFEDATSSRKEFGLQLRARVDWVSSRPTRTPGLDIGRRGGDGQTAANDAEM